MEAALHVNKASGHTLADVVRGVPPETHSSEGGGVWAEYLPKAALMSNDLFLDDVNVLVPVWLGGRGDRPGFPIGRNRIFREVPIHRVQHSPETRSLAAPWVHATLHVPMPSNCHRPAACASPVTAPLWLVRRAGENSALRFCENRLRVAGATSGRLSRAHKRRNLQVRAAAILPPSWRTCHRYCRPQSCR